MRNRLARLERRTVGRVTVVGCPECGVEVRATGDLALEVLAAQWAREAGTERHRPERKAASSILDHPHAGLLEAALSDIPGAARASEEAPY